MKIQKKLIILICLFILFSVLLVIFLNKNNNQIDLMNYPRFLNDPLVVIDDKAPQEDIKSAKLVAESLNIENLTNYLSIQSIFNKDAIYIGTCDLEPRNKFTDIYVDCLSLKQNQARIRLVSPEQEDTKIIFVVGKTINNTRKAAEILANYKKYKLKGNNIEVNTINNETILKVSNWK